MKNITTNELIALEQTPQPIIPDDWIYETANKSFDAHIKSWRRLSTDVVSELWVFYNKLAFRTGTVDKVTNVTLPTWQVWLDSKGISHVTPLRHFKRLGWIEEKPQPEPEAEAEGFHDDAAKARVMLGERLAKLVGIIDRVRGKQ